METSKYLKVVVEGDALHHCPLDGVLLDHLLQRVKGELDGGDSEEGDQVTRVGRQDADGRYEEGADDDTSRGGLRHPRPAFKEAHESNMDTKTYESSDGHRSILIKKWKTTRGGRDGGREGREGGWEGRREGEGGREGGRAGERERCMEGRE